MTKLSQLVSQLLHVKTPQQRYQVLSQKIEDIEHLEPLTEEETYLLNALVVIGQRKSIHSYLKDRKTFNQLIEKLKHVDRFYSDFGGLVGYQSQVLRLLSDSRDASYQVEYLPPQPIDIGSENKQVRTFAIEGIRHLDSMAEMYAIGGAADRLNLTDRATGKDLPAAKLVFLGRTLLERLVRDLFAREYLHYKLFKKQIHVPLAMMTSHDKNNDHYVRQIWQENEWFGRRKESVLFFCQPLVPTFLRDGSWAVQKNKKLLLKPGGHGVIWKLAIQEGVFHKLQELGKKKALVRQINNPIAGVDYGLSAFIGAGIVYDYWFGFASCPRKQNAKEGINVMKQIKREKSTTWALSNVEYCDARAHTMVDEKYPANTNILFIDLQAIEEAVKKHPYPGVVLNFKQTQGVQECARLELTMQNIADFFEAKSQDQLRSYLTINERKKTISVTKRAYIPGESLLETPEGCLIDFLCNARDLFTSCGFEMPSIELSQIEVLKHLPFYIDYHPALGPYYSIIRQKLKGGYIHCGSELKLEIADLYMENISIEGSLLIEADAVMGHKEQNEIAFSDRSSKAILKNVQVVNQGIDYSSHCLLAQGEVVHRQRCMISVGENAEFIAENVLLKGDLTIRVPSHTRCTAFMKGRQVEFHFEALDQAIPLYQYRVDEENHICLTLNPREHIGE